MHTPVRNQPDRGPGAIVALAPAGGWPALGPPRLADWQRATRDALGLATDRAVVLSGHQAQLWHAGIAAKWFAIGVFAAQAAWLVVDQDVNDVGAVAYPTADLARRVWRIAPHMPGVASGCAPPTRAPAVPTDGSPESVREGLGRIARAWDGAARESSLARQAVCACAALLDGTNVNGAQSPAIIDTAQLARTRAFAMFVELAASEPGALVACYNEAVKSVRGSGLRELAVSPRLELPFWRVQPGRARRPVFADGDDAIRAIPLDQLRPRAIAMTALVRLACCDLFIHGLGGGKYDLVMERWMALLSREPRALRVAPWLAEASLAPMGVVSATRTLPARRDLATPETIAHAAWLAHSVRHDPLRGEDALGSKEKTAALQRVRDATTSAARLEAYRAMHAGLEQYRERRRAVIDAVRQQANDLRKDLGRARVAFDRTWAFPLLGEAEVARLRADVEAAVREGAGAQPGG